MTDPAGITRHGSERAWETPRLRETAAYEHDGGSG